MRNLILILTVLGQVLVATNAFAGSKKSDTVFPNAAQSLKEKEAWKNLPEHPEVKLTKKANHVFLHYDYMYVPGPKGHSHAPSPEALRLLVHAFKQQGLVLHIDPNPVAIPEIKAVTLQNAPRASYPEGDVVSIYELKAKHYRAKNRFEHYAIFGHYSECVSPSQCLSVGQAFGMSGVSNLPGYNSVVSFGLWVEAGRSVTDVQVAGTLMHELGHNFGLRHGGRSDVNYIPQYLSVMNYAYQFGIPNSSNPELITETVFGDAELDSQLNFRIDFSSESLGTISEGNVFDIFTGACSAEGTDLTGMDENQGFVSRHAGDILKFYTYDSQGLPQALYSPANGSPIDWNANGVVETNVFADINADQSCTEFQGANDWQDVKLFLSNERLEAGVKAR